MINRVIFSGNIDLTQLSAVFDKFLTSKDVKSDERLAPFLSLIVALSLKNESETIFYLLTFPFSCHNYSNSFKSKEIIDLIRNSLSKKVSFVQSRLTPYQVFTWNNKSIKDMETRLKLIETTGKYTKLYKILATACASLIFSDTQRFETVNCIT